MRNERIRIKIGEFLWEFRRHIRMIRLNQQNSRVNLDSKLYNIEIHEKK